VADWDRDTGPHPHSSDLIPNRVDGTFYLKQSAEAISDPSTESASNALCTLG